MVKKKAKTGKGTNQRENSGRSSLKAFLSADFQGIGLDGWFLAPRDSPASETVC